MRAGACVASHTFPESAHFGPHALACTSRWLRGCAGSVLGDSLLGRRKSVCFTDELPERRAMLPEVEPHSPNSEEEGRLTPGGQGASPLAPPLAPPYLRSSGRSALRPSASLRSPAALASLPTATWSCTPEGPLKASQARGEPHRRVWVWAWVLGLLLLACIDSMACGTLLGGLFVGIPH